MFVLNVLETLLSEGRSVLGLVHPQKGSKRVKISVRNQQNVGNFRILLEK